MDVIRIKFEAAGYLIVGFPTWGTESLGGGGGDKIEQVEGEGEAREHCPWDICLSIRCLYPVVGDGGEGGRWNGMQVTDPSLAYTSGEELR